MQITLLKMSVLPKKKKKSQSDWIDELTVTLSWVKTKVDCYNLQNVTCKKTILLAFTLLSFVHMIIPIGSTLTPVAPEVF